MSSPSRNIDLKYDPDGNILVVEKPVQLRQVVIESLLKPELLENNAKKASFWARECKIASKLIKERPEEDFWNYFGLNYKLNSLAFLMSERGKSELGRQYANWGLTKRDDCDSFDDTVEFQPPETKFAVKKKFNVMDI